MENPNGAVPGNSQNNPTANVPRTFSTFPLKYHFFDTHRFGEYHPHYVEEGVKNDKLPIRSSHNVTSYTLKSPLMQDIIMYKDYFLVPKECILPLNWEKFFDNPVRGDDVNNDVGPTVVNFWNKVASFCGNIYGEMSIIAADSTTSNEDYLTAFFRTILIFEMFYSDGNLLSSLGCSGSPYVSIDWNGTRISIDRFIDDRLAFVIGSSYNAGYCDVKSFKLHVDGYTYLVYSDDAMSSSSAVPVYGNAISFRHALSLMRDNLAFSITDVVLNTGSTSATLRGSWGNYPMIFKSANVPHNLSRLWAYQLCCSHYYSNDHIDFVYSAELYRQLIGNYMLNISGTGFTNYRVFTRNGITYQYDYLSAHYFSLFISTYVTGGTGVGSWHGLLTSTTGPALNILGYLSALLSFRRSLRFQDYFTGSRAQPLAVGSTGVTVSGSTVDVVDVTRNIQRQRFLNAVNRVRHNFEGYLQGIFGGDVPAPDYHNPFFLASTQDVIYGQQTENTADAQMSDKIAITSNLRSNGSRYMIEINCDRPCIVLGITHYDLPRAYGRATERAFFHVDRFDEFNPFMQYIGDQPLYIQELGIDPSGVALNTMANFSYQLRHSEWKQRFNQACGGFIANLPGFVFLANDLRGDQTTINPDWIRSVPSELDNFYVSLTGYSLASYFHFIVDNFNDCSGTRPMSYAPSIL